MIFSILLKAPSSPETTDQQAMREFIKECKLFYKNDTWVQKDIESYQKNYKSEEAIQWYSQTGFFFRLLNKGLRTQNIDILFTFRSIIVDVFKQIQSLYYEQRQKEQSSISSTQTTGTSNTLNVYRGQLMSYDEFQQIQQSIGGFIAANTFLSTTLDKTVAIIFSGDGESRQEYESVILSIYIDKTTDCSKTPYANIQHLSKIQDEYEIILSIGTVFKIQSVEKLENCWNIELILCNEEFLQELNSFEQICQHEYDKLANDQHIEHPAILCAFLSVALLMLGEFERGTRYMRLSMNQISGKDRENFINYDIDNFTRAFDGSTDVDRKFDPPDMYAPILHSIFETPDESCDEKENDETSVHIYEKALLTIISTSDLRTKSVCYHCLARLYERQKKYEQAIIQYEKILQLTHTETFVLDALEKNDVQRRIGEIYAELRKPVEAIKHLNESIDHLKEILPLNHFCFAIMYKKIGHIYCDNNDSDNALKYFKQSAIIFESSNDFHIQYNTRLADVYEYIAAIQFEAKDYEESLLVNKKIIELNLNPLRFQFYEVVWRCGENCFYLNNYDQANEYYQQALDILLKYHKNRVSNIAETYHSLGHVWQEQKEYYMALENFKKSLQYLPEESFNALEGKSLSEAVSVLTKVYKSIADCQYELALSEIQLENVGKSRDHIDQSLTYYKKALALQEKYLPESDLKIGYTKWQIAQTFMCMARFQESADILEELLAIYSEQLTSDYKFHAKIYKDLSFTWGYLGDYTKARECHEKSGSIIFDQLHLDEDLIKQYFQSLHELDQVIFGHEKTEMSNNASENKA